jgi:hypothetical protein
VCHDLHSDPVFYHALFDLDQEISDLTQSQGCIFCGETLHVSNYERRPRGAFVNLSEPQLKHKYSFRFSFCCSQDGCRRRVTPPTVRFLGRKVYLGFIIVLVCALKHGLTPRRALLLCGEFNIPRQTITRWRRFWCHQLTQMPFWKKAQGTHAVAIQKEELPGELLGRFTGGLSERLQQLLKNISPVTCTQQRHFLDLNLHH